MSPAKAIFADGDSIVVSLNFQSKAKDTSGGGTNGKEPSGPSGGKNETDSADKKKKSSKSQSKGSGKSKPLKKTILIDLETSPIQEQNIGVSPTLIVLSDDDDIRDYNGGSSKSKGNSTDRDGVTVSTTCSGNPHDSNKSPSYHDGHGHGVQADSTQLHLQQPHQSDSGKLSESSLFSRLASSSPDETGNGTPTRGDSLVTSTRDSMEGTATHHDDYTLSPFTPPKEPESSPMATTPPLPPGTPPRLESKGDMMSGPSSIPNLPTLSNSSGSRPLGIGNIPGLFVSSSMLSTPNGGILVPSPVVIPTPPIPQLRLPQPVTSNLFNQSVLATVANALYGPLMGTPHRMSARPNLSGDGAAQSVSSSGTSRGVSNVIGKKYGGAQLGNSVLLPKDQNSHSHGHGRRSGDGGGDSPFSPNSSDGDDLFEPPTDGQHDSQLTGSSVTGNSTSKQDKLDRASTTLSSGDGSSSGKGKPKSAIFDSLFGTPNKKPSSTHHKKPEKIPLKGKSGRHHKSKSKKGKFMDTQSLTHLIMEEQMSMDLQVISTFLFIVPMNLGQKKEVAKLSEEELRQTGDVPTSAVELRVKEMVNVKTGFGDLFACFLPIFFCFVSVVI